jgi:hypothetical protein
LKIALLSLFYIRKKLSSGFFSEKKCQVLVAHTYNPSYLEGLDQENCGSRPAQANSLQHPISKITRAKWTGDMILMVEHLLCQVQSPPKRKKNTKPKIPQANNFGMLLRNCSLRLVMVKLV